MPERADTITIEGVKILRRKVSPQVVRPRIVGGVDHGAASEVLLEDDQGRRLIRVPGHRTWKNTLDGSTYDPTSVWFEPPPGKHVLGKRLSQGRLSKGSFLIDMAEELPGLFGLPKAWAHELSVLAYHAWKYKHTAWIGRKAR